MQENLEKIAHKKQTHHCWPKATPIHTAGRTATSHPNVLAHFWCIFDYHRGIFASEVGMIEREKTTERDSGLSYAECPEVPPHNSFWDKNYCQKRDALCI